MMPSLRSILILGLPLLSTALAQDSEDATAVGNWEEVIESLPGESLRAALQENIHQYREGIFEDGRNAIDAVRSDDPALAAALVELAKQDAVVKDHVRKRQASNTTTASVPETSSSILVVPTPSSTIESTPTSEPPTSTQDPTTPSSTTAVPVTTPTSTTTPATSTPTTTAPGTTAPAPTTTTTQQTTPTTEATSPQTPTTQAPPPASPTNVVIDSSGSIVTSVPPLFTATESDGDTIVLTSPTPGGVYTAEDQSGNVAIVTYTPGGGTVSQIRLLTTTLPDGEQSVITSFQTVGAPVPTSDGAPDSEGADDASLQSGATVPSTWYSVEVALIFCAAIGVAGIVL